MIEKLEADGEPVGEPSEDTGPVSTAKLRAYSPSLAKFVFSENAMTLYTTWPEVHTMMGFWHLGGAKDKEPDDWRKLLLNIRNWADRDPWGRDSGDEELVAPAQALQ